MRSLTWLKSIWTIIGGIIIGICIGLWNKGLALELVPFGDLYLAFLKMCVIPIMMSAIVSSLGRLLLSKQSAQYLKRMIVVFAVSLLIVSSVGILIGLMGKPGELLSDSARSTLGQVLADSEGRSSVSGSTSSSTSAASNKESGSGFASFFTELIPSNIFISLVEGNSLQILFFSIVVGVTLGLVRSESSEHLLSIVELVFKLFQKAIAWSMYILPIGLMCIMAGQIASTGVDILLAMVYFIGLIYLASVLLMILSAFIISRTSGMKIWQSVKYLKQTLMIALGTRNSIATMPSILDTLRLDFKLDEKTINLVIPLGVVLCRYSMVLVFAIAIVFSSQLYYIPLGIDGIFIAMFGVVLAAVAGAGSPAVVSMSMLSLVAVPLGIPYETVVILLLAINPVIDPIVTMANVHINCATAVVITKSKASEVRVAGAQDLTVTS